MLDNLTENDLSINSLSLNMNEYQSQVMGYRKNKLEKNKLKERLENVEGLLTVGDKGLKKSKAYEEVEEEN